MLVCLGMLDLVELWGSSKEPVFTSGYIYGSVPMLITWVAKYYGCDGSEFYDVS